MRQLVIAIALLFATTTIVRAQTMGIAINKDSTLTGTGSVSSPLGVNTTNIQRRVGGSCSAGSAIASIDATGNVTCETDDGFTTAGPGLESSGLTVRVRTDCATNNVIVWNGTTWVCNAGSLTLSTMTQGSVLFAGASGVITQDNPNFFWDDTNNRLGIGTTASPALTLDVRATASAADMARIQNNSTAGFSSIGYHDTAGTGRGFLGFANSSTADTNVNNSNYWNLRTSPGQIVYGSGSVSTTAQYVHTNGNTTIGAVNGDPAVQLRVRGDEAGHTLSVDNVAGQGNIRVIGTSGAPGYTGYVIAKGTHASPTELWVISRNGTNNDDGLIFRQGGANDWLRYETSGKLTLKSSVSGSHSVIVQNNDSLGFSAIDFQNHGGSDKFGLGHDNASLINYIAMNANDLKFTTSGNVERMRIAQGGDVTVGNGSDTRNVTITADGTETNRFDDNSLARNLIFHNRGISAANQGSGILFALAAGAATAEAAVSIDALSENTTHTGATADGRLSIKVAENGTLTERVLITSVGQVGFGVSGPTTKVDAAGTIRSTVSSGAAGLVAGTSSKQWTLYPSGSDLRLFEYSTTLDAGGGNDRVTFEAGGFVGIGETNPAVKVHVRGTGGASGLTPNSGSVIAIDNTGADSTIGFLNNTHDQGLLFGNGSGAAYGRLIYTTSNSLDFYTANTSRASISSTGLSTSVPIHENGWTTLVQAADQDVTNAQNTASDTFTFAVTAGNLYALDCTLYMSASATTVDAEFRLNVSAGTINGGGNAVTLDTALAATNVAVLGGGAANTNAVSVGTDSNTGRPTTVAFGFAWNQTTTSGTATLQFGNNTTGVGNVTRMLKGSRCRYKQTN